ncbi:hypothetical protein RvY_03765 [Ramazzottius varieornatus]|uniref:Uncharacterized protein n=1 Tax=Ramazzottius varieornatus TaxID=947166 RepID=A0A1D1UP69_RAMVA|nr:hypothetical protein RvY_03765 [Ramazzottius varieornatus]
MVNYNLEQELHFDDRYECFGVYHVPASLLDDQIELAFEMWVGLIIAFKVYRGVDYAEAEGSCYVDIFRDYHFDETNWLHQEQGLDMIFETLRFMEKELREPIEKQIV